MMIIRELPHETHIFLCVKLPIYFVVLVSISYNEIHYHDDVSSDDGFVDLFV